MIGEIQEIINSSGINTVGEIVENFDHPSSFIVFFEARFDSRGRRSPSHYKINILNERIRAKGYDLTFIAVDSKEPKIESSLKTFLFGRHPESIRNAYSNLTNNRSEIWIEPKGSLETEERKSIEASIDKFFEAFDPIYYHVYFTNSEYIPTQTAIIKTVRIIAPCSIEDMSRALEQKHFKIPSIKWLSGQADRARKSGFVLRNRYGQYVLTLKALSHLGTSKSRQSPDVLRALDLARRGV